MQAEGRRLGPALLPVFFESLGTVRRFVLNQPNLNQPNLEYHITQGESTCVLLMARRRRALTEMIVRACTCLLSLCTTYIYYNVTWCMA